jgi:hypothetical protein
VQINPRTTARDLVKMQRWTVKLLEETGTKISISTVKQVLYQHNLKGRSARTKPLLQNRHKKARLRFATAHGDKDCTFWRNVLWSVYYSLHRTARSGSNQNRKRSARPQCTTERKDKYIRVSSLRNRHLTSPQFAASLNSTCKTPVSTSTVKRRLWDAGLLGRVAMKNPYLRLANKNNRLRWAEEHRHWTEELCLEGQYPRVTSSLFTLRLVFCGYYISSFFYLHFLDLLVLFSFVRYTNISISLYLR